MRQVRTASHSKLVCHVDMLVVDSQFLSVITDNQTPDGTRALSKGFLHLVNEIALINNLQPLFDFTSLGHANESAIITDINKPVLLEDRAQKGVKNNRW